MSLEAAAEAAWLEKLQVKKAKEGEHQRLRAEEECRIVQEATELLCQKSYMHDVAHTVITRMQHS